MLKMTRKAVFAAMLFFAASAQAVIPEPGLWWNSNESGRGYTIEVQDDGIFVLYFGYQPDGTKSAFYETFGRLDVDTGIVRGYWASAEGGQCFGCPHREPVRTVIGQVEIRFTSSTAGQIRFPSGEIVQIQRQLYMADSLSDPRVMLGIWTFLDGAFGVYFGEALWFQQLDSAVPSGFSGRRLDASASRRVLGGATNNPSLPRWVVLLDSSATYYTAYAFDNSVNTLVGRTWTYPKTGQLSGPGLPSIGQRLMGHALAVQAASAAAGDIKVESETPEHVLQDRASASLAAGPVDIIEIEGKSYSMLAIQAEISRLRVEMESR